ncbi:hypothetical protein M7I_7423 [Glarea lozoyensis 74030]|uniref:Uncharacterized protein n=1 Tax=Glarea lozoyensis (strain ATCC 74030 / MF5533) TaxID=1104152 RepID=H0EX93_GLAL7|nr:hypothetical protein M7I_7423 [Glarea lozoyensis 74030]
MLLCQYGASTLAKFLRRSIVNTMNTEGVAGIPSLPTESMRTGRMLVNGARAASTIPRPRSTPQPQKIWHPNHGIVFQPSPRPGIARMTSVAAVSMERDMALHSNAEDSYVLASSGMSAVDLAIQRDIEGGKEVPKPFQIPDPVEVPYDPRWDALPDQTGQTWKMPEELFRAAKDAEPGTPESYWSHSLYRGPPDEGKPDGKTVTVHYCKSETLATDDPEEAEESKPEEPDTPLPPKRKSTKKTLTYYDESGDFDFKDVEPETTFQAEVFVPT